MSVPWERAWQDALYGPDGFYRAQAPAAHFRTAAHAAGGVLASALAVLARSAGCGRVVEVGAGRGELLTALHAADPALVLVGVDLVPRPDALPDPVGWGASVPSPDGPTLLVAWELLDIVPCPVLGADDDGRLREVLVAPDGTESLGGDPSSADLAWAARWWPGPYRPGDRVEVGTPRERRWATLVEEALGPDGLALTVDYDHHLRARPAAGSLASYRGGRLVAAVPDGRHDVTAHVALDAVAAAVPPSLLLRQHEALARLGAAPVRPHPADAVRDPRGYLEALARRSEVHELTDPAGLGGFGWLVHARGGAAGHALA